MINQSNKTNTSSPNTQKIFQPAKLSKLKRKPKFEFNTITPQNVIYIPKDLLDFYKTLSKSDNYDSDSTEYNSGGGGGSGNGEWY